MWSSSLARMQRAMTTVEAAASTVGRPRPPEAVNGVGEQELVIDPAQEDGLRALRQDGDLILEEEVLGDVLDEQVHRRCIELARTGECDLSSRCTIWEGSGKLTVLTSTARACPSQVA